MRARFCRFGGTTTTWSDHTVVSAISRLQSSPETAPPECNRTGRCATLRAPHPVLLLRRAIQAQINLRLYSTLDESWGSRQHLFHCRHAIAKFHFDLNQIHGRRSVAHCFATNTSGATPRNA